jgi:hypothetical protein
MRRRGSGGVPRPGTHAGPPSGQAAAAVRVARLAGGEHDHRAAVGDPLPERRAGPQEHRRVEPRARRPRADGVAERLAGDGYAGISRERAQSPAARRSHARTCHPRGPGGCARRPRDAPPTRHAVPPAAPQWGASSCARSAPSGTTSVPSWRPIRATARPGTVPERPVRNVSRCRRLTAVAPCF